MRLLYGGRMVLLDPYLAAPFTLPSFTGRSPNPMVPLPCPPEEVVAGVEMVLVSHLHTDHFDAAAREHLPGSIPVFCQPGDADRIRAMGFAAVHPIEDQANWSGIELRRMPARHGTSPAILLVMGDVSGFVLQAPGEPTVYWAGDTVWTADVAHAIERWRPGVIITHSSGAVWGDRELIVMDAEQTVAVCRAAPDSFVVAVHMETLDHGTVSREALRSAAKREGVHSGQLVILNDGEVLAISGGQTATRA